MCTSRARVLFYIRLEESALGVSVSTSSSGTILRTAPADCSEICCM
jgi:hypothetical protein